MVDRPPNLMSNSAIIAAQETLKSVASRLVHHACTLSPVDSQELPPGVGVSVARLCLEEVAGQELEVGRCTTELLAHHLIRVGHGTDRVALSQNRHLLVPDTTH
jgi:hypothetical protein